MYKVVKSDFEALSKKVNAIGKKLDKHGLKWSFEVIGESVEQVDVYRIDAVNGGHYKDGKAVVDVVEYTFEMETLKIGDWQPIAAIDHKVLIEQGAAQNMVHAIADAELSVNWWTADSNCEHCNRVRSRNKTVILRNEHGETKQVGTTCIKDFTGIDAGDIIALYASVDDIFETEPKYYDRDGGYSPVYVNTVNYLAFCIKRIRAHGYCKDYTSPNCTKHAAFIDAMNRESVLKAEAQEIISYYSGIDSEKLNGFENNVKSAITAEYSKINGILAYAPLLYPQTIERIKQAEAQELVNAVSQWQGEVGEKLAVEVEYVRSFSYEGYYGYSYIHLFKDSEGNVYKWGTGKSLNGDKVDGTIKGTVKSHDEYNDQRQTVLTRCAIS